MTPRKLAHITRMVTFLEQHRKEPAMTTPSWENWQTAAELRRVSKLAKDLDDMVNRIFRNAAPDARQRLERTALYAIEVSEITESATTLAGEFQAEADAEVEAAE